VGSACRWRRGRPPFVSSWWYARSRCRLTVGPFLAWRSRTPTPRRSIRAALEQARRPVAARHASVARATKSL
jgi:hypothetical protein